MNKNEIDEIIGNIKNRKKLKILNIVIKPGNYVKDNYY